MGKVKIRYYTIKNGNGFWQPNARMKAVGFEPVPCGKDGSDAWKKAELWNDHWDRVKNGVEPAPTDIQNMRPMDAEELTIYPPGSIGDAFKRYRRLEVWREKAPRTRDDWFRGWAYIKPIFGDVDPGTVDLEMIDGWRSDIQKAKGIHEAWIALKYWRALWNVMKGFKMCGADPSKGLVNTSAKGRTETWQEGEIVRICKQAWREGYYGLSAAVAVIWDTQFSPVDVRLLTPSQRVENDVFDTSRAKTPKATLGTLSKRSVALLDAYIKQFGAELHNDAPIFRNRSGSPYTKDKLAEDFRLVRQIVLAGEVRQMRDMRRSGAVEAAAGDVSATALAAKMANSINQSKRLQDTYMPKRTATVKLADEARRRGRTRLRGNEK